MSENYTDEDLKKITRYNLAVANGQNPLAKNTEIEFSKDSVKRNQEGFNKLLEANKDLADALQEEISQKETLQESLKMINNEQNKGASSDFKGSAGRSALNDSGQQGDSKTFNSRKSLIENLPEKTKNTLWSKTVEGIREKGGKLQMDFSEVEKDFQNEGIVEYVRDRRNNSLRKKMLEGRN